jgi:1,4-alpha-glucan branching enzyme
VFNWHWEKSFTDYRCGISKPGKYKIVLDSDSQEFGGFQRINKYEDYFSQDYGIHGWQYSLQIYIPCRTALVFALDK